MTVFRDSTFLAAGPKSEPSHSAVEGLLVADAPKKLEDNPKDALEAYLRYMWSGYYKWYESAVASSQRLWLGTQAVAIAAGFGTAVLAALSGEKWFQEGS